MTFLAIAGRAGLDATTARAEQLIPSGAVVWALDEAIWAEYEVFGQPVTFAITADGVVADTWYGLRDETSIRSTLDALVANAA